MVLPTFPEGLGVGGPGGVAHSLERLYGWGKGWEGKGDQILGLLVLVLDVSRPEAEANKYFVFAVNRLAEESRCIDVVWYEHPSQWHKVWWHLGKQLSSLVHELTREVWYGTFVGL